MRPGDADVALETVLLAVEATADGAWSIEASCRLRGGTNKAEPLVLRMHESPLTLTGGITDPEGGAIDAQADAGSDIIIEPRPGGRSWAGTQLVLHLEWSPEVPTRLVVDKPHGVGLITPCLVLPDMLPSLFEVGRSIEMFSRQRPRIRFATNLPHGLNAGGVAIPDWRGQPTFDLLQTVVCRVSDSSSNNNAVAVTSARNPREMKVEPAAYERLVAMGGFIATTLHISLPVRPVICVIDSYATGYPGVGAFCPVLPGDLDVGVRNIRRDLTTVMQMAQSWFDGGVRVWGENVLALRLGAGIGLGLSWLERIAGRTEVDRAIADLRAAIRPGTAGDESLPADVARAIGLSAFEAGHAGNLWRVLGKRVRKRWGERIPQQEFVDLLREAGVSVPHVFG